MPESAPIQNPTAPEAKTGRTPDPCVVVIFGATGDLAQRKLLPALFMLGDHELLPQGFSIVGISRSPQTDESYRETMFESTKKFLGGEVNPDRWKSFAQGLFYHAADVTDPKSYQELIALLDRVEKKRGTAGNRLFYLAVSPEFYMTIVGQLGEAGLARPKSEKNWTRIIIEKPFGRDLTSARALNEKVCKYFTEDQIYRIDHYLGKETVQNILVFRFANSIFEPIWNHQYIDHIQIIAAENIGIENRGSYYDKAGALRDMVQNHMLQLVCTIAMEPPISFNARAVRDEKSKLMEAVRPIKPSEVSKYTVRGQYSDGYIDGQPVQGYRKEKNVAPDSRTETYTAIKLFIDNWRWADVPFYLRTGKRLPKRVTEIAIQFKRTPHLVFARTPEDQVLPNLLLLRIQPDEGIGMKFEAKQPGPSIRLRSVNMEFQYGTSFATPSEEAYERLLLDALLGDATLFARGDWIELAWAFITPILEGWEQSKADPIPSYPAGSFGPSESDVFIALDNRRWRVSRRWVT